jgi:hypothetical protein
MTTTAAAVSLDAPAPRWPGVVGTIGIVIAILTLLDKAGDLLFQLLASGSGWAAIIGPKMGPQIAPLIPPAWWIVLTSLAWAGLAILLLRASLRLRRREPEAIPLCRAWSWLAIGWFAVEMAYGLWWLNRISGQLDALAPAGWQGYAVLGILMGTVFVLALPVFLLVWLERPVVRREVGGWQLGGG